jgi:predicted small lipoprotein YifL
MSGRRILVIASVLAIAGCGRITDLKPAPGQSLPVKPLMAKTTPSPKDLLKLPPYAKPDRVDELIKRSQPRQDDPFELPPPTGGSAPTLPAGSEPQPVSNETGPSTPGD